MSEQILSISEAQEVFPGLPEQFEEQPGYLTITRNDKPVMTVLPYSAFEFLLETVESLQERIKIWQKAE